MYFQLLTLEEYFRRQKVNESLSEKDCLHVIYTSNCYFQIILSNSYQVQHFQIVWLFKLLLVWPFWFTYISTYFHCHMCSKFTTKYGCSRLTPMSVGLYFHKIMLWRIPRAIFTARKQSCAPPPPTGTDTCENIGGYLWFQVPSGGAGGEYPLYQVPSRKWVSPVGEGVVIHGVGTHPPPPHYWHLMAATTCAVGKRAVHILVECILVSQCHGFLPRPHYQSQHYDTTRSTI